MSRWSWFVVGMVIGVVALVAGGYGFVRAGGVSMETTARPLPFERQVAHLALRASIGNAAAVKDPLALDDDNMLAGAQIYKTHCAVCHGLPGQPPSVISQGMFPPPPQLLQPNAMVTDDPEGVTYWKVTHGIRLSGMPGFGRTLSETQRWQVTMFVGHADELAPAVKDELAREPARPAPAGSTPQ